MLIIYVKLGIYPFGGSMIVKSDLYQQILPFLEEMKDRIVNRRSLFYSWEGGLGKPYLPQMAYYSISPVNLLIFLFPKEYMTEAAALIILIKVALSASTFNLFLKNAFNKNDIFTCVFSLFYAFMAFVTCYYIIIMWLDAIILLPLVVLGIENIIKKDKHLLYCISLSLVIILNFYMALLVCIFSVVYFIAQILSRYSLETDRHLLFQKILRFAVASLIAGGISMFISWPTLVALSNTAKGEGNILEFSLYSNIIQTPVNHFIGSTPVLFGDNSDLPNIYTGLLTVLMAVLYFFSDTVKRREKMISAIVLIVMLVGFSFSTLNYIIHGMYVPANFPHRYTFMYSFFILTLAYKAFINVNENYKLSTFIKISAILISIMLITQYAFVPILLHFSEYNDSFLVSRALSDEFIIVNILFLFAYSYITYKIRLKKSGKKLYACLCAVMIIEITVSSYTTIEYTNNRDRQAFLRHNINMEEVLDYINNTDDDFHRTELRRQITKNDAAYYHYKGFNQFSSITYANTQALMRQMGVTAQSSSYRHYDLTPLLNSIFNIKYIISKEGAVDREGLEFVKDTNGMYLYNNKYWLELGFMVDNAILGLDLNKENPFDPQNDFIRSATGIEQPVFIDIAISSYKSDNIQIRGDTEDNKYSYNVINPQDMSKIPTFTAIAPISQRQRVFIYVEAGNASRIQIKADGKVQDREINIRSLFDIGTVKDEQDIEITMLLDEKVSDNADKYKSHGNIRVYIASFDIDLYESIFNILSENTLDVYDYGDDYINGRINVTKENSILFTSIPFDKGWSLSVDGNKSEIVPIMADGLIGIPLDVGEHVIEMAYSPRGLVPGIILSFFSLAAVLIVFSMNK
jgi:uncharacterized membrane protein YfhO